jgi:hypothetical protein
MRNPLKEGRHLCYPGETIRLLMLSSFEARGVLLPVVAEPPQIPSSLIQRAHSRKKLGESSLSHVISDQNGRNRKKLNQIKNANCSSAPNSVVLRVHNIHAEIHQICQFR